MQAGVRRLPGGDRRLALGGAGRRQSLLGGLKPCRMLTCRPRPATPADGSRAQQKLFDLIRRGRARGAHVGDLTEAELNALSRADTSSKPRGCRWTRRALRLPATAIDRTHGRPAQPAARRCPAGLAARQPPAGGLAGAAGLAPPRRAGKPESERRGNAATCDSTLSASRSDASLCRRMLLALLLDPALWAPPVALPESIEASRSSRAAVVIRTAS